MHSPHTTHDTTGSGGVATRTTGERVELRRYRITAGERALVAQRIHGRVAVVDVPVDHADRVYLVERHVTSPAELAGICAAYAEHSEHADRPAIVAQRCLLDGLADHGA